MITVIRVATPSASTAFRATALRGFAAEASGSCGPEKKRMWDSPKDMLRFHKGYVAALPGILGACEYGAIGARQRHMVAATSRLHHSYLHTRTLAQLADVGRIRSSRS